MNDKNYKLKTKQHKISKEIEKYRNLLESMESLKKMKENDIINHRKIVLYHEIGHAIIYFKIKREFNLIINKIDNKGRIDGCVKLLDNKYEEISNDFDVKIYYIVSLAGLIVSFIKNDKINYPETFAYAANDIAQIVNLTVSYLEFKKSNLNISSDASLISKYNEELIEKMKDWQSKLEVWLNENIDLIDELHTLIYNEYKLEDIELFTELLINKDDFLKYYKKCKNKFSNSILFDQTL